MFFIRGMASAFTAVIVGWFLIDTSLSLNVQLALVGVSGYCGTSILNRLVILLRKYLTMG
jgi:hypothetical protein